MTNCVYVYCSTHLKSDHINISANFYCIALRLETQSMQQH